MSEIKQQLITDMYTALKQADKQRLSALRLFIDSIKKYEIEHKTEVTDSDVIEILYKLVKQRKASIIEYRKAQRIDLMDNEQFELRLLQHYLPDTDLSTEQLLQAIDTAIASSGVVTIQGMGKVMQTLRANLPAGTDIGEVARLLKTRLAP